MFTGLGFGVGSSSDMSGPTGWRSGAFQVPWLVVKTGTEKYSMVLSGLHYCCSYRSLGSENFRLFYKIL